MANAQLARVRHEIVRRAYVARDVSTLRAETLPLLRRLVPIDAVWWSLADPDTLLFSRALTDEVPRAATPLFLENELLQDDVNKFAGLAREAVPVCTLLAATGGRPERSARFRDILRPNRMGDEMRLALRDTRHCWGFMCLHREAGAPAFSRDDQQQLLALAPHLAAALRQSLLRGRDDGRLATAQSGVLVVTTSLEVVSVTASAEAALADLDDWARDGARALPVMTVVSRLLAIERAVEAIPSDLPLVRVRARSGRWLTLSASRLRPSDGHIAVVVEPARSEHVVPLVLAAAALTDSETRVAVHALRGLSNKEIGHVLSISPMTVQQHLKGVFEKTRVHSRGELLARVHALTGAS
jgi:DNA-binding CsgD family transcriptional regulator